jgi:hypothetical protein
MFRTKVIRTLALAGCITAGKPGCANRQERSRYSRKSMEALRLAVAVVLLSVSTSWITYGQKNEAPPDPCLQAQAGVSGNDGTENWIMVMQVLQVCLNALP